MCVSTTKTIYACGCIIADHKPGIWCLLGEECQKVDHRHITTKRSKETCADCFKAKEQKDEETFLQEDGFTVVTKDTKSTDTKVAPKRPAFTHKQGIDLANVATKNLNDLLQENWIVGQKNHSLLEHIIGLPRFIPRSRLIETWVWWAVGRESYSHLRAAGEMAARREFDRVFDVAMANAQNELHQEMEGQQTAKKP
ncbi:hypothetical protein PG994_013974 [Apiospora phragmitis]|uniref:Uncharacterized protein n=1 Tax=Apiospora phragmitis TaxID=2905665 RepID=A0ABR1T300_9PEZI